jgi:hypothetical protein
VGWSRTGPAAALCTRIAYFSAAFAACAFQGSLRKGL